MVPDVQRSREALRAGTALHLVPAVCQVPPPAGAAGQAAATRHPPGVPPVAEGASQALVHILFY